jgi:hypothetical protein
MAIKRMTEWYFEYELHGDTHVCKATSGTDEEETGRHLQQIHPEIKIIKLMPLDKAGGYAALLKRKEELEMDPNHVAHTGQDLRADATQKILDDLPQRTIIPG